MPERFNQYYAIETLSKKYSHVTYLASPIDEPEHQLVLTVFSSFLFRFPHERENLLQKAQCIRNFEHKHIVPILDMGVEAEQPFIVREYLPNGSLRTWLKQLSPDRLPLQEALSIIMQVGEALVYAHKQNIVHGNIKPENIFIDANGQALLADFHLVSRKDACIRDQTSEEYAFCYLAPEQFAGITDVKSDQYALGCLTYELITGRAPFAAQSLVSMMGQANHTLPAPLSESVPDIFPSLDAAVLKTLDKDPTERFLEFSLFLEVIQSVLSPPPSFPLAHAVSSHKNRAISRPVRSTKVGGMTFPLGKRAASPDPASESPEASVIAPRNEFEEETPMNPFSIPQIETHEEREIHPLSKQVASSGKPYQIPFPFPGEVYLLAERESEKRVDDRLINKSLIEEGNILRTIKYKNGNIYKKQSVLPVLDDVPEYDFSDFVEDEVLNQEDYQDVENETSTHNYAGSEKRKLFNGNHGIIDVLLVWSDRRRVRGLVLLISAVMALTVYIFWSSVSATHDTDLHIVNKTQNAIPQATSVSMDQIPLQVADTPTVQPSATKDPTVQPVVKAPVTTIAPIEYPKKAAPTPTPTLTPTPTPTPTPTDASITYEAESSQNTLAGGARIISCSNCSGGYRVGYIGLGSSNQNGTLQFNNINKADAGTYTLTLYYSNGSNSNKNEYISVNGGSAIIFTGSPTGGFDKFATAGIAITLHGGENTIEFYNPEGEAPDIDKIII